MYQPTSETPIQLAVGIINDFMLGSIRVNQLEDAIDTYQNSAHQWANNQLRDEGYTPEDIDKLHADQEAYEDQKIYDAYYRLLTQFNRKVLTAAANSQ